MKLGIVGKGHVGTALHRAYESSGAKVAWWWSRRDGLPLSSMAGVEVIIIAVSDPAVAEISQALSERDSASQELWLHTSGSLPGEYCRISPSIPRSTGALHPLCALNGQNDDVTGCVAGVDGERNAVELATSLALALKMRPVEISGSNKALYHAAAVSVAGHAVALFHNACSMLESCGFDREQASQALLPLMQSAVAKLRVNASHEAMTGPIPRGDDQTLERHINALEGASETSRQAYYALAHTSLEVMKSKLQPEVYEALKVRLRGN